MQLGRLNIDYPRAGRRGWSRFVPSWRQVLSGFGLGIAGLLLLFGVAYATVDVPDPNELSTAQTTVIRYSDGRTEIGRVGAQNRISVPLRQVPRHVRYAVLAAENRGHYSEPGISPRGIARALWVTATGGEVQGGSTITQQYAKNAYLTQDRTVSRKLKEIVISIKLGRQRSKDEILEDYLNTIYFGRGAYGIQTAATTYFNKDVSKLTVSEAAVLAAVIRAPAAYDPVDDRVRAQGRWRYVLDGMVDQGWLTPQQRAEARFPEVRPVTSSRLGGTKGYVIRAVEKELLAHGFTANAIELSGLRVTTTLSRTAQDAAEKAVRDNVPTSPADLRTALVAVEPGTGRIIALYGGADYTRRQFDNALQGRVQPGSTFKPFVLVAALDKGIGLRSRYDGRSPQTIRGEKVTNFGSGNGRSFGRIDLLDATANSVNTVYAQLGFDAGGPSRVAEVATAAGITTKLYPDDDGGSLFLGGIKEGVRPVDMANAFATFAAQGDRATTHIVTEVRNRSGKVVYRAKDDTQRAFDRDVMADTSYALQQVLRRGTATSAQLAGGRPAAGKTGTTSRNKSAWFCGYTPQLAASVALFRDGGRELTDIGGRAEVTGGSFPAAVWKDFMDATLAGLPVESFPPPANVGKNKGSSPSPGGTSTPTPSAPPTAPVPVPTVTVVPLPTEPEPTGSPTAPPSQDPEPTGPPDPTLSPQAVEATP